MKIARVATAALTAALTVGAAVACGSSSSNNNNNSGNLSASQRTELQQKMQILLSSGQFGSSIAGFAALFAPALIGGGSTSDVSITTDLAAQIAHAVEGAVAERVANRPSLQATSSGYRAMAIDIHFNNPQQPTPDLTGIMAFNGFPVTKMIIAFNLAGSGNGTIGGGSGTAAGGLATFSGTCTSSSNCTTVQWLATSGTVNVTPTGSSGGTCAYYNLSGSPITCNTQSFSAAFNLTAPNTSPNPSARTAALNSSTVTGIKLTVNCQAAGC